VLSPAYLKTGERYCAARHNPEEERQYRCRYLLSQWGLVIVALGGIAVAICSLRSLNRSVTAANSQAWSARQQLELSERAWVAISKIAAISPIQTNKQGATITYAIVVRNVSKAVATDVSAQGELITLQGIKKIKAVERHVCEMVQRYASDNATVFPDQEMTVTSGSGSRIERRKDGRIEALFFACVVYRDSFQKWRHTKAGYYFHQRSETQTEITGFWSQAWASAD
jgi:hypothetical protein